MAGVARHLEAELANLSNGQTAPWRASSAAVSRTAEAGVAMLLRSRASAEHVAELACAMLRSLAARQPGGEDAYLPGVSAGIAFAENDRPDGEQLLQRAHAAAEHATTLWTCETYSPVPTTRSRRRLKLESVLRTAIERGELSLAYQPRVAIDSYELAGVECLARLRSAELGGWRRLVLSIIAAIIPNTATEKHQKELDTEDCYVHNDIYIRSPFLRRPRCQRESASRARSRPSASRAP